MRSHRCRMRLPRSPTASSWSPRRGISSRARRTRCSPDCGAESPVHRCEPPGFEPFWAITKYHDIFEISTSPDRFASGPGITVLTAAQENALEHERVRVDAHDHHDGSARALGGAQGGQPGVHAQGHHRAGRMINQSARETVDRLAGSTGEGECDFATDVAAAHPLRILSTMLGRPARAGARHLAPHQRAVRTRRSRAAARRAGSSGGDHGAGHGAVHHVRHDHPGPSELPARRPRPLLANGKVDGEPMGPMETVGYYLIVFSAGHDTTKNALVGGMNAFLEHPEELAKLAERSRSDRPGGRGDHPLDLAGQLHEAHRCRGHRRSAGRRSPRATASCMFYASANRDEDVFDDPFEFRIDREIERHLGVRGRRALLPRCQPGQAVAASALARARRPDWSRSS